jgi:glycosyltransferase involved in cell wall biosynthesis
VRLLYPAQLPAFATRDPAHTSVFHNFVAVGTIEAAPPAPGAASPYILFLGYPWYLKGVDVLIRAFLRIADRFPGYTLRIVGHCPDRSEFENLRGGCDRIRFERAVPHEQAVRLMEGCSLFVLPSRTEAMGRVLLEAMAAAKPIIASAVDGIPHYIEHGRNGLLFRSEDDADLAAQMERVLADPAFARELGLRGHAHVHERLSEEQYALRFREMVDRAIATSRKGAA